MKKGAILIAGLGAFKGAGIRLSLQCKPLQSSHDIICIDDYGIMQLAQSKGLPSGCFSIKEAGYSFWQWKFLLISHYCGMDYDNIVYMDAGCDANSRCLRMLISWFGDQDAFDLVLSRTFVSIAQYTKPSVAEYFRNNYTSVSSDLKTLEMLQAGFILLKPKTFAGTLFDQAASLVIQGKKHLFDDTKVSREDVDCSYVAHKHDQSVLNLLLLASPELQRVGALHTCLTPPGHLRGWGVPPPVIASRNWSCLPMYQIVLRFGGYHNAPKLIRFIYRILHVIAKKAGYPIILLAMYIQFERLLLGSSEKKLAAQSLFSTDGGVSPAPVSLLAP